VARRRDGEGEASVPGESSGGEPDHEGQSVAAALVWPCRGGAG
jgi:hypothetical protein